MRYLIGLGLILGLASGCDKPESPAPSPAPQVAPAETPKPGPPKIIFRDGTREIEAPAGSGVSMTTTTTRGAEGTGAGIRSDSAEATANFNAGAPTADLGGDLGGGAGGGISSSSFKMSMPRGTSPLLWVGVALILGAAVALYMHLRRAATFLGLFGLAFLGASALPGVALFIVCGGGAVVGGAYLYAEYRGKSVKEALRGVVAGVEGLAPDARAAVKAEIAKQADPKDKAEIRAIKAQDGL